MAGAPVQAPMHSTSSSENIPSGSDFVIADFQLLLREFEYLISAAQHARDIGAHLHVIFAGGLAPDHGIVGERFGDLQRIADPGGARFPRSASSLT